MGNAIPKIQSALLKLSADKQVSTQLNLLLAECYTHLNWNEQRLAALRNAGSGPAGSEAARLELARLLADSYQFDEALAVLLSLVEGRPEIRLEVARLSIRKAQFQPTNQRDWQTVERRLG